MSVAIADGGVAGLALEHTRSCLRVRQLDAIRMIGAPLGRRRAQERIVRRRRRRGHERGEYRLFLAHPFFAWPASRSRSAWRLTFPAGVFGSSFTTSMARGYSCWLNR